MKKAVNISKQQYSERVLMTNRWRFQGVRFELCVIKSLALARCASAHLRRRSIRGRSVKPARPERERAC